MKHQLLARCVSLMLVLLWMLAPLSLAEQILLEHEVYDSDSIEANVGEMDVQLNGGGQFSNSTSYTLKKNATIKLVVGDQLKVKLKKGTEAKKWVSSKKSVATVNQSGVVVAKKKGTAKITVTTTKKKKLILTVKVSNPTPKKITFEEGKSLNMTVGEKYELTPQLSPDNAETVLTWKSSNADVAKVSKKGVVQALKKGKATITVTTGNKKKAKIVIKVKPEPLTVDKSAITVKAGEMATVKITYQNDNTLCWDTDESIATCYWHNGFDGDTCELSIKGLDAGTTTVLVYDEETLDAVEIKVTVSGHLEKVTELARLLFTDIPTANAMLNHKLSYYKDNMYTCEGEYFSVVVDSSGTIDTIGFFNDYGDYTLFGLWPGCSISTAMQNLVVNGGWELQSDTNHIGTFTNSDLPGCVLRFEYANSKVSYIILTY